MNSKWSYLVSNQYLPSSIAKNAIVYQLFQNFLFLQGRIFQQETEKKCKSSESSANHSIRRLSLYSSESNGVSKNPFGKPGVLVSLLSPLSKQTLPARDCVPNQSCRQRGSLRSTLKRRWPFDLRSFVICPFRAQLLGGSLPYSLADILRYCLSKLLFINWLKEEITTAKNKLLKRSTVCSCHMFAASTVDMCYIDTFLLNQNTTHEIPSSRTAK